MHHAQKNKAMYVFVLVIVWYASSLTQETEDKNPKALWIFTMWSNVKAESYSGHCT